MGDDLAHRMTDEFPLAFIEGRDPDLPPAPEPAVKRRSWAARMFRRS
jgi:hypothetical protein